MSNQEVLDVLNSLEVVEQQGGEDAYILASNNDENRLKLAEVGVQKGVIENYGDEDTFCILALSFNEGYADSIVNGKLVNKEDEFVCILENLISNAAEEDLHGLEENRQRLIGMYRELMF